MPLLVTVHPDERLVIATGRDKVSIRDIEDYLNTTMANNLLAYAKLVAGLKLGPLAIDVRAKDRPMARLYEMLATADRPIKLFSNGLSARTWLDKTNGTVNRSALEGEVTGRLYALRVLADVVG